MNKNRLWNKPQPVVQYGVNANIGKDIALNDL